MDKRGWSMPIRTGTTSSFRLLREDVDHIAVEERIDLRLLEGVDFPNKLSIVAESHFLRFF